MFWYYIMGRASFVVEANQRDVSSSSTDWTQAVTTSLVLRALCKEKNAVSRYAIQAMSREYKHQRTRIHMYIQQFYVAYY